MPERPAEPMRGLPWVLGALAAAVAPHVPFLPGWISLLIAAAVAWRWAAERRAWPLPPRWLRVLVAIAATLVVLGTYRTLNGIEAGTAFLVLLAGVKLLETRGSRDLTVIVFIAYFLLYSALLRDQRLPQLPYLLAGGVFLTAALMRVHAGSAGDSARDVLTRTGALLLQALPLAVLLFVLFPRLPGPFWGIGTGESARTGLGDEMTPGDISDLSVSGAVAFRVRFSGELPPPAQRYWRGPVLHEFDGRSWRRPRAQAFPSQEVTYLGEPVDYQITLEPTDRPWILALDIPAEWPEREAVRTYDFQLVASRRLSEVSSFRLRSYPSFIAGVELPQSLRRKGLQLPEEGNPRSRALARRLAAQYGDPRAIAQAMLTMFREQPFVYTLDPPKLAENAMDEFLFETRRGFCEHYASAFTLVMRAAGVPARVVSGYQGGEFNPLGGYLIVRQSDAHAWSEIWIEGRGWLRVDPTAAVAPERIERGLIGAMDEFEPVPGRLRDASNLWMQVSLRWDTLNDFWNERVVRFNAARQLDLLERLGVDDPDWRTLGLGMAASLAAFFVGLSAYLAWRFRPPARDWPARLHDVVRRRLVRRGLQPQPPEGPVAFLERAAAACPDLAADLAQIRDVYVDLRYGPLPTDADLRRLKHLVNRLRP
ncbi:MAG: protein-glutamine gamma-glutamyltransferase [Pseudomonadota bacterium]|nr:protein-glutamine gamma-glutamyltransferase [Pseudomonadota bacterium]MDQ1343140.1 protein-glutamine gamma-glutamyltransferase [Pseudomonadota bacterium]